VINLYQNICPLEKSRRYSNFRNYAMTALRAGIIVGGFEIVGT
jgi:hypothetical protein